MKKLFTLAITIVSIFAGLLTVNAANVTITNEAKNTNVVYNAYKMLDLEYDSVKGSYVYTVAEDWEDFFNNTENQKYVTSRVTNGVRYVTAVDETKIEKFATKALAYAKEKKLTAAGTTTINKGETEGTISLTELGYYVIDSSLGTVVRIDSNHEAITVNDKNGEPTITKTDSDNGTASVGDTKTYTVEVEVKAGAQDYIITDTLSKGLTLDKKSFNITYTKADRTIDDPTVTPAVTENNDGTTTIEISYKDISLKGISKITITYDATVNAEAAGLNKVSNRVSLTYGDDGEIIVPPVDNNLYKFNIKKVDQGGAALDGAKFKLYTAAEGGKEIAVIYDDELKAYRPIVKGETAEEIEAGEVTVVGLAEGTYYLEETVAPEGYSKLTTRVSVDANKDTATIIQEVVNVKGQPLPSTGGFGTTLFVSVGTMMVLSFGVLLVSKMRMAKNI